MTLESLGPNSRQTVLTERACRSPTCLTDASANSRAVFNESTLRLEDCNGSNGGPFSTVGKSQGGTLRGRGGLILLAPHKNWVTALSLPTNRPAIGAWKEPLTHRRRPGLSRENGPFQSVEASGRRGSSFCHSVYNMLWEDERLLSSGHTCRAHNSGGGCLFVLFALREEVPSQGDRPWSCFQQLE